ncbi:Gfo/Idh/MocA family protein [Methylorubrum extorquens]|uniref:Oxidoreductase domain protein n=1 Tax=Methylorubrum extorquens (strain CM4 / NCIMB 13688) TaxID=440085 RepID=B7KYN2_METC4|nr:Gfo/Idh/MocA family oxidoreductase [Methylorubrum extorquens]ACK84783.1 oxidoreductase domain protein [Methylorubrum extorquens CM4]
MSNGMASCARIGIVGLGRMGERIGRAAIQLGHEIVATHDVVAEPFALATNPDLAAAPRVQTLDEFWRVPMDMVAIATHGPTHCPYLLEGIERGNRRFLVEKPLATSLAEARLAASAASAVGARVVVNHGRRYCGIYDALTTMDGSDEMGSLRSGILTMGAGGLGCMGIHFFDLFNRALGRPRSVYATLTSPRGVNPRGDEFTDPGGTVVISYEGGRRALIDMGDDVGVPGRMEFVYERGRVVIESELEPWRILRRPAASRELPTSRYGTPLEEVSMPDFRPCEIIYATSGAITDALSDGPTVSGIEVGVESMEVYCALRWSALTGAPASVPLPAEAEDIRYAIT